MSNLDIEQSLFIVFVLLFAVFFIASMWKAFEKAGQPGWAALIPIYNYYIMTKMGDQAWWMTILMCIPYVNLIAFPIVSIGIAKNFQKGTGFGIGLVFLSFIFWPILGFGDASFKSTELTIEDNLVE